MRPKNQKVKWTEEEDQAICSFINKHGAAKWTKMAQFLHQTFRDTKKSGKQCRQRWLNHLNPSIVREKWTIEEEKILFDEQKINGNKWSLIAEKLPGRSDNAIKNHFYSLIRKNIRRITKIVGGKDGTRKVKKLKPIVLSRIFQLNVEENNSVQSSKSKSMSRSEIADYLINFSKENLKDRKISISHQLMENLRVLLKKIEQMNQQVLLSHQDKSQSSMQDQQALSVSRDDQKSLKKRKKNKSIQGCEQFIKNTRKRKSQSLQLISPIVNQREQPIFQGQFRIVDNIDGKQQNEKMFPLEDLEKREANKEFQEGLENKFNFCIHFSEEIVQDIDFIVQENMFQTPYMITPNKKKKTVSNGVFRSSQ